ncbi:MAG: HAMP domain-containing histidine kinase [Oscillospiraceae bacterium]|nr:HAMP domain-containing histidine kinase [Oscillospiraceae bacterium]
MPNKRLRSSKTIKSAKAAELSSVVKSVMEDCVNLQNISLMKISEKDEKIAEEIREQGYYILRTCHDMNEYLQILSGEYKLLLAKTELCSYLEDFCKEVAPYTARKGIAIISALPEDKILLKTDPEKLCYALANIVLNSMENSPNGTRIKITLSSTSRFIKITVADRGFGMSEETLERCAQPLFTKNGRKSKLGLGLTLAGHFAAESGGRLSIKSKEDKGTAVSLSIPLLEFTHETAVGSFTKTDFENMAYIIKTVFSKN